MGNWTSFRHLTKNYKRSGIISSSPRTINQSQSSRLFSKATNIERQIILESSHSQEQQTPQNPTRKGNNNIKNKYGQTAKADFVKTFKAEYSCGDTDRITFIRKQWPISFFRSDVYQIHHVKYQLFSNMFYISLYISAY